MERSCFNIIECDNGFVFVEGCDNYMNIDQVIVDFVDSESTEDEVAVLLSAQCTDERVNKVTPTLFSKAKNPLKMSKLTEDEIYRIIKPCGLGPKKSKAIKALSEILVNEYDSEVTSDIKKLEKLEKEKEIFKSLAERLAKVEEQLKKKN